MAVIREDTNVAPTDRRPVDPEVTMPRPSFGEVTAASIQNDNFLVNMANNVFDAWMDPVVPDPEYDATQEVPPGYEQYADSLVWAVSREDMARRLNKIDQELAAKETIASASGLSQLGGAAIAAATDPISMIPIGGTAYRTYRTSGRILEGAAKTGAVAAAVETGREAYLQNAQTIRTGEESFANIATATFLGGVLGGAAAGLSRADADSLIRSIDKDMDLNGPIDLSSVGARQVGLSLEQESIKGVENAQKFFNSLPNFMTNPVYRGAVSPSKIMRQMTEKLGDLSLVKNKNTEGIESFNSVENRIKGYDALKYNFYKKFKKDWKAYRDRVKKQKAEGGIPMEERFGSNRDGSMTYREFSEEITRANRRNDEHVIPEVQSAAQAARAEAWDPILQRQVNVGVFDDMDIDVKTSDSWARRMWNKDKILYDRQRFKEINVEWLKKKRDATMKRLDEFELENAAKIKAKDAGILKELDDLKFRADQLDEEIESVADNIIDQITGLKGGRLGYDIKLEPKFKGNKNLGARGSAKRRVYDIPDEMVEEYLVNDVHALMESHIRTASADTELLDVFGTLDQDVIKKQVQEDYARLFTKAKTRKESTMLNKLKQRDLEDIDYMWEKLRGVYKQPDDYAAPYPVLERALLAWNYTRLLGGMTVSSLTDVGRPVMVHGMARTMNDGIRAMITDFKGFKAATEDLREAAVGLDMVLSSTALTRANMDEWMPAAGRVDAVSQGITGGFSVGGFRVPSFGNLTLMNPWNTAQKTLSGVITQTRMLRAIQNLGAGKDIPVKELENLASHGIGKDMARAIADQFKKYGEVRDSVLIPNARSWDDAAAANLFRSAVRKQVDEIIVTPGLDRPIWMSEPGFRLLGQFRSFSFASMQRVTLAGLQQGDAHALSGVMMMIGLGAMVYGLKETIAGRPLSDDPRVWITEGVDRSGATGWFFDVNNVAEKVTRGRVGMNALIGGPTMSRYASRSALEAMFGPSLGTIAETVRVLGAGAAGDWGKSDTTAMRRLLPYQNVVYLRTLFDEMEKGVNARLGVEE